MSTYNGERYIREQLDSILAQKGVNCKILVRDDGSSDSTASILDEYRERNMLMWYQGENVGPAKSFMQLLYDAEDSDYFAFSDQDDYWKPEKLRVAVDRLKSCGNLPALYFCKTQPVDINLHPIETVESEPLLTFGESLVYELCSGCTLVINRELRNIVKTCSPSYIPMHDVWVYSVAHAVGAKVFFDKTPYIFYRQHGDNAIGQGNSALHEWKKRIKRLTSKEHERWRRAFEIKQGFYGYMPDENKKIIDIFVNGKQCFLKRLRLFFDKKFKCADRNTFRMFKIAVITNTY